MNDNEIKEAVQNDVVKNVLFNFGKTEQGDFVLSINIVFSVDFAMHLAKTIFGIAKAIAEEGSRIIVPDKSGIITPFRK